MVTYILPLSAVPILIGILECILPAGQIFDRGRDSSRPKARGRFSKHPYQVCSYLTTRGRYSGIYMNYIISFTQSWISQLHSRALRT